jgi:hypothetical protein
MAHGLNPRYTADIEVSQVAGVPLKREQCC